MNHKEVIKALKQEGWVIDRTTKHCIMKKGSKTVPIPVHGSKDIPLGTLKYLENDRSKVTMTTTTALYPAHIWKKDGVYYVQFLDLEEGFTYGKTLKEAKEMATDVLSALLTSYIEHHQSIPEHSDEKGKDVYLIAPDAKVQAALLLRDARADQSQAKIAHAMGTTWQAYQKIEQLNSNTTLAKLQKAAKALGRELVLEFR